MAKFKNAYPGNLYIPGRKEPVKPEETVDLKEDQLKNEGVKGFVKDGWLVAEGPQPKTKSKTKKRQGLEDQANELEVAFTDETSDDDLIAAIKAKKEAAN